MVVIPSSEASFISSSSLNSAKDSGFTEGVDNVGAMSPLAPLNMLEKTKMASFDFSATRRSEPVRIISTGLPSCVDAPPITLVGTTAPSAVETFSKTKIWPSSAIAASPTSDNTMRLDIGSYTIPWRFTDIWFPSASEGTTERITVGAKPEPATLSYTASVPSVRATNNLSFCSSYARSHGFAETIISATGATSPDACPPKTLTFWPLKSATITNPASSANAIPLGLTRPVAVPVISLPVFII